MREADSRAVPPPKPLQAGDHLPASAGLPRAHAPHRRAAGQSQLECNTGPVGGGLTPYPSPPTLPGSRKTLKEELAFVLDESALLFLKAQPHSSGLSGPEGIQLSLQVISGVERAALGALDRPVYRELKHRCTEQWAFQWLGCILGCKSW
uniref:Uncharacterized protein n=1 Tax=Rangifer tarandus platyrhynchus TaxID=3082113 RepID=A0ACB0EZH2_RANTA|nr:unnamed protein product [Rangifer tarandus platyrhynchus]